MQLDQSHIAIRERGYFEILDLALRVLRAHATPLCLAWLAGVLPMILLNAWLLQRVPNPDDEDSVLFYFFFMTGLMVWQLPLATAPLTLCLGQILFAERLSARRIARDFFSSLPQLLVQQVLLRAFLVPWVLTWFILFARHPYRNEVILLERTPMSPRRGQLGTGDRLAMLHEGYMSDAFARWVGGVMIGVALFVSLYASLLVAAGFLLDDWWPFVPGISIFFPVSAWLVLGLMCIVRFLGYLDLRIRREGWEVELLMRAEAARLTRHIA